LINYYCQIDAGSGALQNIGITSDGRFHCLWNSIGGSFRASGHPNLFPGGKEMNALVALSPPPALVAVERASMRFLEFFAANIRNPHTRRAYAR
jgi:hypothetical protein